MIGESVISFVVRADLAKKGGRARREDDGSAADGRKKREASPRPR